VAVIALVGVVHSTSHLFQFALPPMFPLLKAEFGVELRPRSLWSISTFYLASGLGQAIVGIRGRSARRARDFGLGDGAFVARVSAAWRLRPSSGC
jgi:MFS transporter, FSR family, fosmidomycin resistance protein